MINKNHIFTKNCLRTICSVLLLITINADAKEVIGIYEKVSINGTNFSLRAKIDTGAKNSSLNAVNYEIYSRDGENWIRFDMVNKEGKTISLNKRVKRYTGIKRKNASSQKRPAILLDICIGKVSKKVEVNLVDRSNFNYQLLIGRSFLHGAFIVDVEKTYTSEPRC